MRRSALAAAILLGMAGAASGAQPVPQTAAPAEDPAFSAAFDLYWRARLLGIYAGTRVCALPNSNYDDPRSPFRPIDARLTAATAAFERRFPGRLNRTPRPYQMPPPMTGKCADTDAAHEALFAFDTAVAGLEAVLAAGPRG